MRKRAAILEADELSTGGRRLAGCVNDCTRSGPPKKVPQDHYWCIDNAIAEN